MISDYIPLPNPLRKKKDLR